MLFRFLRGSVAAFVSTLSILLGYGVPLDFFSLAIAGIVGLLTGLLLAIDKGGRSFKFFKDLNE
jgi:hypothetical protein